MDHATPNNLSHPLPIVDAEAAEEPISEDARTLGTISRLLSYPGQHYIQLTELLYVILQSELPEAARCISEFGQFVEQCDEYELEELYTRTFDVNPSCALEIGWHLFGEDYVRGQFLVRMREELSRYEIPESSELPDHLTHALAVLAAMPKDEAHRLTHACVFPALGKMQRALDGMDSPYRHLIGCLVLVLEHLHGAMEPWSEEDELMPSRQHAMSKRKNDTHPGQNGPRPPGLGDPLRAYPMPGTFSAVASSPMTSGGGCGGGLALVPLQMNYKDPEEALPYYVSQDESPTNSPEGLSSRSKT